MISICLFITSLIPPITLYGLLIWSRRRSFFIRTLIIGATLVHELLLVVFPTVYSIFTDFRLEGQMLANVTADDLFWVMVGESVFILMFAFGLVVRLPRFASQGANLTLNNISERSERIILNILILVGCLVYVPLAFSASNIDEKAPGLSIGQLLYWLKSFFWFTPLVACAFLFTKRGGFSVNPARRILSAIPLVCLIFIGIGSGTRGRIIWAISLLLVAGIFNQRKKIVLASVVMAIFMIPIFSILGNADIRGIMSTESSRATVFKLVYEEGKKSASDYKELGDIFLNSFAWRAQGVRNSVTLYQDFEHGGGGFKTYLGSIFLPIPRLLWTEKPMMGSLDHSEFESAMYKVMELAYGGLGQMGPMLSSAHAYWEGGWVWLIVAGLITGLIWNIIFNYCRHLPDNIAAIIILTFAAAHMVDGLLTMLVPIYSLIDVVWLSLLPLFIIYKCIIILTKISSRPRSVLAINL